jgi:5'-nucleotidase
VGHAITYRHAVTAERVSLGGSGVGYALSGTPADCVHFALTEVLEARPDVIVSGMNPGPNLGFDVFYSGTVAAAIEGSMNGILSVAFSSCRAGVEQLPLAAAQALRVLKMMLGGCRGNALAYNVNIPALCGVEPEVRFTRHRTTPFSVWCEDEVYGPPAGTEEQLLQGDSWDVSTVEAGMISVTPLRASLTDMDSLRRLQGG